jgi:hypothetical protein
MIQTIAPTACRHIQPSVKLLALWTDTGEDRLMLPDVVPGLIGGHLARQNRDRDVDIGQFAADETVHVIMAVSSLVEAARLIAERKLLDNPMFGQ